MKKITTTLIIVLAFLSFGCDVAQEDDKQVIISNFTFNEIYFLYVSPSSSESWGNDVLGENTLGMYEDVAVKVNSSERFYDIGAEDQYGNYYAIWDVDIANGHISISDSDRVTNLRINSSKNTIKQ